MPIPNISPSHGGYPPAFINNKTSSNVDIVYLQLGKSRNGVLHISVSRACTALAEAVPSLQQPLNSILWLFADTDTEDFIYNQRTIQLLLSTKTDIHLFCMVVNDRGNTVNGLWENAI